MRNASVFPFVAPKIKYLEDVVLDERILLYEVLRKTSHLFPFTIIWVSDTKYRKKTLICMHNEVNKTIKFGDAIVLLLLKGVILEAHSWDGSMLHDTVPSVMQIISGVQAILWAYLSNFRGCNIGNIDGSDL
jgi:hypothetical protein